MNTISKKGILGGDLAQLHQLFDEMRGGSEPPSSQSENGDDNTLSCFDDVLPTLSLLQRSDLAEDQSIVKAVEFSQFDDTVRISPQLNLKLFFADQVFQKIIRHCCFDQKLASHLKRLRIPFIKLALIDDSIYVDQYHYGRVLINELCAAGITWYADLGKAGQLFENTVATLIAKIVSEFEDDPEVIKAGQLQLSGFLKKQSDSADRLEKRLCDSEVGAIRAKRSEHMVLKFLNKTLAGKQLPPVLVDFLQIVLRAELRFLIINKGSNSEDWKRWKKIIETLVWVFQPQKGDDEKQHLYSIVPALGKEIQKNIGAIARSPVDFQTTMDELEALFIQVLKGNYPECIVAPPLIIPDDVDGIDATVSRSLLKKAEAVEEGTWMLFHNDKDTEKTEDFRCKLALKIPDTDQFLFVNRNGQKLMQKGVENFAFCLSTKMAEPLSQHPIFIRCLSEALDDIFKTYNKKLTVDKAKQDRKTEQEKAKQVLLEDEQKMQLLEEEARAAAAEKASREAAALSKARLAVARMKEERGRLAGAEKQRVEAEHTETEETEENEEQQLNARRIAKLSLNSMSIGTWMELPNEAGELTKCKLAVKMASSGKHIFVDRIGVKVGERFRDNLIDMLVSGEAKIIEQGEDFEQRLAKVVGGMRREYRD